MPQARPEAASLLVFSMFPKQNRCALGVDLNEIGETAQARGHARKLLSTDVDNCDLSRTTILYALSCTTYPQIENFTARIFLLQHDFFLAKEIENDYELALTRR